MDKLRKSFKSISDQTHQNQSLDERYVLLQQPPPDPMAQRDVVVKINCQNNPREIELSLPSPSPSNPNDVVVGNRVWRDSSYDFSSEATAKVVREFDIAAASPPLSEITESPSYDQFTPRDAGVSFNEANVHRRSNASAAAAAPVGGGEEVLVCSSNSSFERKSTLMRQKSKSRLMDPPEPNHTSRVLKSGVLGKVSEVDEDDPFLEDDLPLEYKTMEFTTLSVLQLIQKEQEEEEKIIAEVEKNSECREECASRTEGECLCEERESDQEREAPENPQERKGLVRLKKENKPWLPTNT
ncbi:hypothetical protein Acr_21g0010890 [Actinidia rufa]|uniref:Uncharacterized protein n=1 Tax=Actinidia rufa TaxID=165716 RepID=A0A7J0GI49_9ERIC|nr:hypothetical protein Acr_21g0010890 [Actinidia rufa]